MKAWITKDIAPMKAEPKRSSSLADEALFGMPIEVLEAVGGDWYRIRTYYGYEGYVRRKHFLTEDLCAKKWLESKKRMVIKAYADVLSEPRVQGSLLQGLPRGSQVAILEEEAEDTRWQKAVLPDGTEGWTRKENLIEVPDGSIKDDESLCRDKLVEMAQLYMGSQYRWGGKTARGLDCSGLCSMACLLLGITIYRDADIKEGFPIREIAKDKMQKGDLLFFPGHVAMYIEDGRYIHSSSGNNGVAYNSFDPEHQDYNEELFKTYEKAGSLFGGDR